MTKELLPDALWLRTRAAHPAFKRRNRRAGPRVSDRAALYRDPVRAEDRYSLGFLGQPVLLDIQLVRMVNLGQSRIAPAKLGT
jgi:hypothetical protein